MGNKSIACSSSGEADSGLLFVFCGFGWYCFGFEVKKDSHQFCLEKILQELAKQEINEIHVEAGATLCGSLIQQKLVDEIILYIASVFMGANAKGLLNPLV